MWYIRRGGVRWGSWRRWDDFGMDVGGDGTFLRLGEVVMAMCSASLQNRLLSLRLF